MRNAHARLDLRIRDSEAGATKGRHGVQCAGACGRLHTFPSLLRFFASACLILPMCLPVPSPCARTAPSSDPLPLTTPRPRRAKMRAGAGKRWDACALEYACDCASASCSSCACAGVPVVGGVGEYAALASGSAFLFLSLRAPPRRPATPRSASGRDARASVLGASCSSCACAGVPVAGGVGKCRVEGGWAGAQRSTACAPPCPCHTPASSTPAARSPAG